MGTLVYGTGSTLAVPADQADEFVSAARRFAFDKIESRAYHGGIDLDRIVTAHAAYTVTTALGLQARVSLNGRVTITDFAYDKAPSGLLEWLTHLAPHLTGMFDHKTEYGDHFRWQVVDGQLTVLAGTVRVDFGGAA